MGVQWTMGGADTATLDTILPDGTLSFVGRDKGEVGMRLHILFYNTDVPRGTGMAGLCRTPAGCSQSD